jgi:hypothetical protein
MAPLINDKILLSLDLAFAGHRLEHFRVLKKRGGDGILMTDDESEDFLKLVGRLPGRLFYSPEGRDLSRWNNHGWAADERAQKAIQFGYAENSLIAVRRGDLVTGFIVHPAEQEVVQPIELFAIKWLRQIVLQSAALPVDWRRFYRSDSCIRLLASLSRGGGFRQRLDPRGPMAPV